MNARFFRSPIFLLYAGGAVIFLVSGFIWWTKVYQSPYRVFWDMLENNLSTSGVTKHITQSSNGTNLDQTLVSTYGSQNAIHAFTTLSTSKSTVKTESIGTLQTDSVRYTEVKTSQKNKQGKPFDFSSILGKWAASSVNGDNVAARTNLFVQTSLGFLGGNLFPQANVTPKDRESLLKRLHTEDIFDTSFSDVKKSKQHGRSIYTYSVKIQPVAFAGFEKAFASALGLMAMDNVDPNQYQGQSAITVNVSVDAWSHQLVAVDFPGQAHHETYANYGVMKPLSVPQATITGVQLQRLLSKIQ